MKGEFCRRFPNYGKDYILCGVALCTCGLDSPEDWQRLMEGWTPEDEASWMALFASEPYSNKPRGYIQNGEINMKAPAPAVSASSARRDDSQRIQFFSVDRLAGVEHTVTIKAVEFVQSNYGDVSFTLEMDGRTYLWDRKLNSNAYAVIIGAFGDETDNWIGKQLTARPYFNPKFKQTEVQVVAIKGAPKNGAKR